ncbi:hypothetical protein HY637_03830 [Candidatus Woesearchaeota archaeon]|nr:hypothetical protein [Candidatus Woesearchaeota archaeon]
MVRWRFWRRRTTEDVEKTRKLERAISELKFSKRYRGIDIYAVEDYVTTAQNFLPSEYLFRVTHKFNEIHEECALVKKTRSFNSSVKVDRLISEIIAELKSILKDL